MNIAVWDTYVRRVDGRLMHFDILVSEKEADANQVRQFGQDYLDHKPFKTESMKTSRCTFCHIEDADKTLSKQIHVSGYAIIEMANCD